jgi:hypothetical protein
MAGGGTVYRCSRANRQDAAKCARTMQVVGIAAKDAVTLVPFPVEPVQADVAHDGADHSALRAWRRLTADLAGGRGRTDGRTPHPDGPRGATPPARPTRAPRGPNPNRLWVRASDAPAEILAPFPANRAPALPGPVTLCWLGARAQGTHGTLGDVPPVSEWPPNRGAGIGDETVA